MPDVDARRESILHPIARVTETYVDEVKKATNTYLDTTLALQGHAYDFQVEA